jgi:hypothetical protein
MRRSDFAAGGDSNFSAIDSHVRDHTNIANIAEPVLDTGEAADGKLTVPQVTLLYSRIIDHAFAYDILCIGALDVD